MVEAEERALVARIGLAAPDVERPSGPELMGSVRSLTTALQSPRTDEQRRVAEPEARVTRGGHARRQLRDFVR